MHHQGCYAYIYTTEFQCSLALAVKAYVMVHGVNETWVV